MNLSRLGLLLAVLLASSKEAIATSSDDSFQIDEQDQAAFDPASIQTRKKNDPVDDDTVLSSPSAPSSLQSPCPMTNSLHQQVKPMHIDRRLDGHTSSFAGSFIYHHDHLRHTAPHGTPPDKPDKLAHHLLRGGSLPGFDESKVKRQAEVDVPVQSSTRGNQSIIVEGRRLNVLETFTVTSSTDNPSDLINYSTSLRKFIEENHNGVASIDPLTDNYRVIKFACPLVGGNTISLLSDLVISKPNLVIDASADPTCSAGIGEVASIITLDGNTSPATAAPILDIQSSAHKLIYRGMNHDRVPVKIEASRTQISHNHFMGFDPITADNPFNFAVTMLSSNNKFNFNEIDSSDNCIQIKGVAAYSNSLFRNKIDCTFKGIYVEDSASVVISETQVLGDDEIFHDASINDPDPPIIVTDPIAQGYVGSGILPLQCNPHNGDPSNGGGVQVTVFSDTFPAEEDYVIEIFSTESTQRRLEHLVLTAIGTAGAVDGVSRSFIIPCIIGDRLRATISTNSQTSDISTDTESAPSPWDNAVWSGWAGGCQCSGILCSDAYCAETPFPGCETRQCM